MISTGNATSELERLNRLNTAAMESYTAALRSMAQYAVEVDESITAPHRESLTEMAEAVANGKPELLPEVLDDSRTTVRALLRDYRDKAAHFLAGLRQDLATTARTLEEILDSLAQSDGDHETRLRTALKQLREVARSPQVAAVDMTILPATAVIEECLEKIRSQHQLTIAQFQAEIRVLHQRIDTLETAVSVDQMTSLFNRDEIEERMRSATPPFCILMLRVQGFRLVESRYGREVAAECAASFGKRLRSGLPSNAEVGRWSYEEFLAIMHSTPTAILPTAKWATENLSGSYSCLHNGTVVRPQLQVTAAVMDTGHDAPPQVLSRVADFLCGGRR